MKTKLKVTTFLVAALLSLPLASRAGDLVPAKTEVESPRVQDQRPLEGRIRHELVMLPYFSVFDHIAFQLDGDEVRLIG